MPPVCHWVIRLGYLGEIYAFGFWVALGFRFRGNCFDMITHQTGTVVSWVKAMRDRRLWPRPGTFLCLVGLFKLFLKILPLAVAKGICALLQNHVHCSMKTQLTWQGALRKKNAQDNWLSRFWDNKDVVPIIILKKTGMAFLQSEHWDRFQAQKNVCFNSKLCTVIPFWKGTTTR